MFDGAGFLSQVGAVIAGALALVGMAFSAIVARRGQDRKAGLDAGSDLLKNVLIEVQSLRGQLALNTGRLDEQADKLQAANVAILACLSDRSVLTARLQVSEDKMAAHVAASTIELNTARERISALVGANDMLVAANEKMVLRLLAVEREVTDPETSATMVERVANLETHNGNGARA